MKLFDPKEHPDLKNYYLIVNTVYLNNESEVYSRDKDGNLVDVTEEYKREKDIINDAREREFCDET